MNFLGRKGTEWSELSWYLILCSVALGIAQTSWENREKGNSMILRTWQTDKIIGEIKPSQMLFRPCLPFPKYENQWWGEEKAYTLSGFFLCVWFLFLCHDGHGFYLNFKSSGNKLKVCWARVKMGLFNHSSPVSSSMVWDGLRFSCLVHSSRWLVCP